MIACHSLNLPQRAGGLENQDHEWVIYLMKLKQFAAEKESIDVRNAARR